MQLLKDIVALLSDKDGSLTGALLKTKVLLHQIGHKELAEWVNDELNGYGEDSCTTSKCLPTCTTKRFGLLVAPVAYIVLKLARGGTCVLGSHPLRQMPRERPRRLPRPACPCEIPT